MGGQMAFEGFLAAFFCLVRTPLQTSNNGVKWDFGRVACLVSRRAGLGSGKAANAEKHHLTGV